MGPQSETFFMLSFRRQKFKVAPIYLENCCNSILSLDNFEIIKHVDLWRVIIRELTRKILVDYYIQVPFTNLW